MHPPCNHSAFIIARFAPSDKAAGAQKTPRIHPADARRGSIYQSRGYSGTAYSSFFPFSLRVVSTLSMAVCLVRGVGAKSL